MDLVAHLKANPFVLAPMAGITDYPFRSFMKELGASVVITELVSAHGIKFRGDKTLRLMEFSDMQRPFGVQIFGETPEVLAEAARYVQDHGADFVDLNFGCPVKKVVCKGAGSAVLRDLPTMTKILATIRAAITIPLTIKVRTGWDESTRNAEQVTHIAYNEGVTWVAIHGRTRAAAYTGLADWDYIAQVKAQSPLPVIGNGDILTPEMAVQRVRTTGCDGVMIGRGCLKNPFIFLEALALYEGRAWAGQREYPQVLSSLYSYLVASCDERLTKIQLRKFAAWFSAGYPESAAFRKQLYACEHLPTLNEIVQGYFAEVQSIAQVDTSAEAFLQGGHG